MKSLCIVAGQYEPGNEAKPLHKCDIEGSKIAGDRLRAGLSLGLSKHWSEALSVITGGEREISADAIFEYFKPLYEFLVEENKKARDGEWSKVKIQISRFGTVFFFFFIREIA